MPDKCCAFCLRWRPNTDKDFHAGDEKTCWHLNKETQDEFYCDAFMGSDASEANVPNHTPRGIMIERNRPMPEVACELLITTYGTPRMRVSGKVVSEIDWLKYNIRSIRKWLSGFQGVTIAHPNHETHLFKPLAEQFDCRLYGYDEVSGKGFVQHQAVMALADTFLPKATTHVLHVDADCCFKMQTTPMDFFVDDKPVYLWRTYDSLSKSDPRNPGAKVVSDCVMWKEPTEWQLGMKVNEYTMTRLPTILPIEFYAPYRAHIEKVHGKPFLQFHLDAKNDHPSQTMDFTSYGAWAFHFMHHKFKWFDCETEEYPIDRLQQYWGHGGINPEIAQQLEDLISGKGIGSPILLG